MLSYHLLLVPFIVPCRTVFAMPEDLEMWPYRLSFRFLTMVRSIYKWPTSQGQVQSSAFCRWYGHIPSLALKVSQLLCKMTFTSRNMGKTMGHELQPVHECQVLHITRTKCPIQTGCILHGTVLESVPSAKYLRITISDNLSCPRAPPPSPPPRTNTHWFSLQESRTNTKVFNKEHQGT